VTPDSCPRPPGCRAGTVQVSTAQGTGATDMASNSILTPEFEPFSVGDGIHLVPTQGNGLVVETESGLVLIHEG
jgi:hypothetical protein